MKFILEIKLGNEGMQSSESVVKALESLANGIGRDPTNSGLNSWKLADVNGNMVGKAELTEYSVEAMFAWKNS